MNLKDEIKNKYFEMTKKDTEWELMVEICKTYDSYK